MFWRKFKLDWQYAIGELAIVTLGVLIALGIQQWNEDRVDRQEEKEIIDRLLFDLNIDLTNLQSQLDAVTIKEESLDRIDIVFKADTLPKDLSLFLRDIVVGANYGWNQDCGLLVNSSRGIIYASQKEDFAEQAGAAAQALQSEMAAILEQKNF